MEYAHVAQIQNLIRRALNHTDVPDYTIKISGLKLVREKVVTKSRVGLDAEDDDDNDSSSIEFGGHSSDEEEKKLKTNKEPSKLQYTLHCAKLSRHLLIAGETAEETAGRLVQLLRQTQNNEDSIQQLEVSCQGALVVFTLSFAHFTSNLLYSLYRLCQAPLPSNEISCKRSVVVSLSFGNLFVKSIDVSILRMVFIARHQLQLYNLQPLFTARAVPDFKFWGLETGIMIAALQRYADRSVISLDSPERGVEEMQRCLLQFEIDSNPETRTSLAISVLQSLLPKSGVDNKDLLELFREAVQCWLVGVWCVVLKESGSLGMFDSKTPASFAKAVWYSFIQRSEPSFTRTITDRIKKTVKPSLEEDLPQQNLFQPTAPRLTLNLSKFSLGQSVPLIDSHGIFTRTFESLLHLEMVSNLTTSDHTVVLEVAELCKTEILKCVQILRLHHQASSPLSSSTSSAESTIIIPVESVCGILDSTAVASQPRLPSSSILSIINRARSAMKRHISSCVSFPASLSPDEQSLLQLEIANELALSAIKTQILRYRHDSKIFKWDWKEIESAEGNQGIGIHYAYTRVCGIRRKSGMPWMGEGFLASLEKLEQLNAGLLACSDEAVQLAYDLFKYHSFMFANVLSPDLSVPSTLTASNTAREAIQIAKSISSACYALRIKNIKDRNLQDARWALLMIAIKVLRHFGMEIMGMGEIQYM